MHKKKRSQSLKFDGWISLPVSMSVTSQIELFVELANRVELECKDPVLIITSGLRGYNMC